MTALNRLDKLQAEHVRLKSLLLRLFSEREQFRRKDMEGELKEKKTRVGLVLEAGAALGAYEVGVVKALYTHYPSFQSNLCVVSGASSGAFNATVLVGAKGNPVDALEQLWRERLAVNLPFVPEVLSPLFLPLTGIPGMGYIRPSILNPFMALMAPSMFDNKPLRQTLADLADEGLINRSRIHLIVTASDVETGRLSRFENHIPHEPFTFEMTMASGSIAPLFPITTVTEQITHKEGRYWDGFFLATLPLREVINSLEQCDGGDPNEERVVIAVKVNPTRSRVPRHMLEIMNRFVQFMCTSKLNLDQELFEKMNDRVDLVDLIKEMPSVDEAIKQEISQRFREDPARARRVQEAYDNLKGHRKIHLIVIETTRQESFTGLGNWSRSAIEDRIEYGYEDAYKILKEEKIIQDVKEHEIPASAAEETRAEEEKPLLITR
jgi:predicted acylesterase/phospholipase RssA